jgi:hypothetical protein
MPLPLALEISRFLAPAVLLYTAIKGIFYLLRREFNYLRARSLKNHIIISSINEFSQYLIKDLSKHYKHIILVEENVNLGILQDYERQGIIIINGSLADKSTLLNVSAAKAKHIILLNQNDEQNISTAISAYSYLKTINNNYETVIHANISNYNKLLNLKDIGLFDNLIQGADSSINNDLRFFSMNDKSSRLIFNKYSPDQFTAITSQNDQQAHIALIGSNEFTQTLLIHFAKLSHFVNKKKLKVTLFSNHEKFEKTLLQTFPGLNQVIELHVIDCDYDLFDASIIRDIHNNTKLSGLYLTCTNDELSLNIINKLTKVNYSTPLDTVLTLIKPDGVLNKWCPEGNLKGLKLHKFNILEETLTQDTLLSSKIDKLAKIIHNDYINKQKKKGTLNSEKASHVAWEQLPIDFKNQNRLQADHIWLKMRSLNIDPKSEFNFDNKPDLVELFSEVEHNRWVANMLLNGWVYGETRDDSNKIHPDLISYDALSDEIKQYDRDTVLNIPRLLQAYYAL